MQPDLLIVREVANRLAGWRALDAYSMTVVILSHDHTTTPQGADGGMLPLPPPLAAPHGRRAALVPQLPFAILESRARAQAWWGTEKA